MERRAGRRRQPDCAGQHGGHGTSGEARVSVDGVGLHRLQASHGSHRENDYADVGHDPVQATLHAPAVPEEANGDKSGPDEHGRHAELRSADATVLLLKLTVDAVDIFEVDNDARKRTNGD
jgi:hypothetical protein